MASNEDTGKMLHPRQTPRCMLNARALSQASLELKSDRSYVMSIVRLNGEALEHAAPEVKDDPEVAMLAMAQSGAAARYASEGLRSDPQFMMEALRKEDGVGCLEFATDELRSDGVFMMEAVNANCASINFFSDSLKVNQDFMRAVIARCAEKDLLAHAPPELQADFEFVKACVKLNGMSLQYASAELRDSVAVVTAAVRENGMALQFASGPARDDQSVVVEAVSNNSNAMTFASKRRQRSKTVVLAQAGQRPSVRNSVSKSSDGGANAQSAIRKTAVAAGPNEVSEMRRSVMGEILPARPSTAPGSILATQATAMSWIKPPEVRPWSSAGTRPPRVNMDLVALQGMRSGSPTRRAMFSAGNTGSAWAAASLDSTPTGKRALQDLKTELVEEDPYTLALNAAIEAAGIYRPYRANNSPTKRLANKQSACFMQPDDKATQHIAVSQSYVFDEAEDNLVAPVQEGAGVAGDLVKSLHGRVPVERKSKASRVVSRRGTTAVVMDGVKMQVMPEVPGDPSNSCAEVQAPAKLVHATTMPNLHQTAKTQGNMMNPNMNKQSPGSSATRPRAGILPQHLHNRPSSEPGPQAGVHPQALPDAIETPGKSLARGQSSSCWTTTSTQQDTMSGTQAGLKPSLKKTLTFSGEKRATVNTAAARAHAAELEHLPGRVMRQKWASENSGTTEVR